MRFSDMVSALASTEAISTSTTGPNPSTPTLIGGSDNRGYAVPSSFALNSRQDGNDVEHARAKDVGQTMADLHGDLTRCGSNWCDRKATNLEHSLALFEASSGQQADRAASFAKSEIDLIAAGDSTEPRTAVSLDETARSRAGTIATALREADRNGDPTVALKIYSEAARRIAVQDESWSPTSDDSASNGEGIEDLPDYPGTIYDLPSGSNRVGSTTGAAVAYTTWLTARAVGLL